MSEPIRILQWGMLGGFGGVEAFIMNVYRHLDREKVQFDFLESHNEGPLAYEDEILSMGGRIYRVMYSRRESIAKSHSALLNFYREHQELAGVHVNANFPYAYPLKVAKEAGIGLRILHSHNSSSSSRYRNQKNLIRTVLQSCEKNVVNRQIQSAPTHYFACSRQAADYMFPGRQFTWIKNGIDTRRYAYDAGVRSEARQRLGIGEATKVIGFCGRFRAQKNPLFMLDIYAHYLRLEPDSMLLLVGIGELEEAMRDKVQELGIEGNVSFLGARTDMDQLYQAMDLFLLPSLFEGLALVYLEAQCAGLPCLVSQEAMAPEAAVTPLMHTCSLQEPAQVWAEQIQEILAVQEEREDGSPALRDCGFDVQDVAKGLQDFYLEHAVRR